MLLLDKEDARAYVIYRDFCYIYRVMYIGAILLISNFLLLCREKTHMLLRSIRKLLRSSAVNEENCATFALPDVRSEVREIVFASL